MALRKLVRRNYGGKSPVSIKYQNLHSFKEGVILLCQSILETGSIIHLNGSLYNPFNGFFIRCQRQIYQVSIKTYLFKLLTDFVKPWRKLAKETSKSQFLKRRQDE